MCHRLLPSAVYLTSMVNVYCLLSFFLMIQPFILFHPSALVGAIDHALPVFIQLFSPAKLALADRAEFFADVLLFVRHNFLIGLFNL